MFQLLLKGCTIEAYKSGAPIDDYTRFQLLLKGCTIEAEYVIKHKPEFIRFSCC